MNTRSNGNPLPGGKRGAQSGGVTSERMLPGRIAPGRAPARKKKRRSSSLVRRAGLQPNDLFPIVGVGASAGGLEAFTQLLKNLPADTGMGFVLVQHLDPLHESALTHLLARASAMPVRDVVHNLRVEPNRVYVIPRNTNLTIAGGVLKLDPRSKGSAPHHSIDSFFESLAHDQKERAIGVVLSGAATDGTLGLEAIKAESGVTFAQDESAKYDSMPRSAIAAGCVDFVLSPAKIAQELARIARHPYVVQAPAASAEAEQPRSVGSRRGGARRTKTAAPKKQNPASSEKEGFKTILLLLRNHRGVDFSLYKPSTDSAARGPAPDLEPARYLRRIRRVSPRQCAGARGALR